MEIKAADVMKLRKMTGAGMMDCKKALIEAEGDFARAQDIIREKGKLVGAQPDQQLARFHVGIVEQPGVLHGALDLGGDLGGLVIFELPVLIGVDGGAVGSRKDGRN